MTTQRQCSQLPPHCCFCRPYNNTAGRLHRGGSSSSVSLARGCLGADPHPAGTHIMGVCRTSPHGDLRSREPSVRGEGWEGENRPVTPTAPRPRGRLRCMAWRVGRTASWKQLPPSSSPPPKAPIAPQPPQLTPSATRSLLSPPVQQPPTQPCPPSSSCPPSVSNRPL